MKTYGLHIGGKVQRTRDAAAVENPYTGKPIARVCRAGPRELDAAIAAAEKAFQETRRLSADQRAGILSSIALGIRKRAKEITRTIAQEAGKPWSAAALEVDRAVLTFTLAAEEAKRLGGEYLPLDIVPATRGYAGIVRRFPIGVIGAISPFNFPLNLVAHKVAPAIATGNTVVLKPPSQTPITPLILGEIVARSGAPAGTLNVVPCPVSVAEGLVTDERVKMLTFTGSPAVGWDLKAKAGKKKVTLELGGNAGAIVHEDADLEWAIPRLALGAYANAGQVCISVQRIYVHEPVYKTFLNRFVKHTRSLKVGDPLDPETVVGPLIDKNAADRVEAWIQEARSAGARVLCGGRRRGNVIEPTVLTDVKPDMKVCCLEVFGPVVTVTPYRRFEEAVAAVDASIYGLQAGVFTRDLGRIRYAYEHLEVGGVIINDYPMFRVDSMPYGGVKDSGFGREGVRYAMEEMTEPRLLVLNFNPL